MTASCMCLLACKSTSQTQPAFRTQCRTEFSAAGQARQQYQVTLRTARAQVRNLLTACYSLTRRACCRDESGATDMSKTALVLAKKCMDCDSRLLAMASCTGLGFWDDKKAQHRQKKLKAWSQDALAGSRNPAHQELLAWQ